MKKSNMMTPSLLYKFAEQGCCTTPGDDTPLPEIPQAYTPWAKILCCEDTYI